MSKTTTGWNRITVLAASLSAAGLFIAGCAHDPAQPIGPEDDVPQADFPIAWCGQAEPEQAIEPVEKEEPPLFVACQQGPTKIQVSHDPLYDPQPHQSTISAIAENTISGIQSIQITVTRGQMTDCTETGAEPRAIPCRAPGATQTTYLCNFASSPDSGKCTHTEPIVDGSLVTYQATAQPATGPSVTSRAITYSGGQPPNLVAAPIWWHTDSPTGIGTFSRLNLAVFPDADFSGNFSQFANDVSWILRNVFHNDTQPFATKFTANRNFFDLWAVPFAGADATGCVREFHSDLWEIESLMRGRAILHNDSFVDCANIGLGGDGSVGVKGDKPDWLLVHESAHFLFGLADEYDGSDAVPVSEPPNTFESQQHCEDTAGLYGWDKALCKLIGPTARWHMDAGEPETMRDREYTSDFHNTSNLAIEIKVNECLAGSCY